MRTAEARAVSDAALTISVSEEDARALRKLSPRGQVAPVPTGVDLEYFVPDRSAEVNDRIVFSGSMDWYPNEDAVLFFANEVLPKIQRVRPNTSFAVVGRNPSATVRALADRPGIDVSGTVDDVRPHVRRGAVQVVPLRIAGGTRLKIFEALAMGQAIVSTRVGAEGLDVEPNRHIVLADDADVMADAVVQLIDSPGRRHALGNAGRALVEARYGWDQVAREFEAHLTGVIDRVGRAVPVVPDVPVIPVVPVRSVQ